MVINKLTIQNFKKYESQTFEFEPHFNLLIGNNGSGKTTILDALAVAAGVWLLDVPDPSIININTKINSKRNIQQSDIHQIFMQRGDRGQFQPQEFAQVRVKGKINGIPHEWTRERRNGRANNTNVKEVTGFIQQCYQRAIDSDDELLPIIAYYGAGRAWLPANQRTDRTKSRSNRWAAFYDCLNERIRFADIEIWFKDEALERGNREGQWRPGFNAVRWALRECVPELSALWFDSSRQEMVFEINGEPQPFSSLSAGQCMMVALVADIAIKMVTQNAHLIPFQGEEYTGDDPPPVLKKTPGLVLIDELDAHLHPSWQRRIASDLKRTFPRIQFVCTTHSPQLIGELEPKEIILLSDEGEASHPPRSFGMDTNRVLEEIMGASPRNKDIAGKLKHLLTLIDNEDLDGAKKAKEELERELGDNDPELTYAESLISFLETPLAEA